MSAVIYAAIVVMWAVVLVPMWLRRHDAQTESRSVDRFSTAMRTLSRRTTSGPGRRYVVMPRRSDAGVSVHVSGAAVAPATSTPAPTPSRPPVSRPASPVRTRRQKTSIVARRRRLFLGLGLVTMLTFLLAVTGVVSWVVQVFLDVILVAFCIHLRGQAKRSVAASRQVRSRAAAPSAPSRVATPRPRPAYRPAPARPAPPVAPYGEPSAEEPLEATGTDGDTWEPVPVPRPTYTLKPPAPVEVPVEAIDPLRDTDPHSPIAAAYDELTAPVAEDDGETDLDDILQRRWA